MRIEPGVLAAFVVIMSMAAPVAQESVLERQDASLTAVRARLRSADLARIAWGGWFVARDNLAAAQPDVLDALDRLREFEVGTERRLVSHALLDALIELDASVPARALLPYRSQAPVQTLVLLAKQSEKNSGLWLREYEAIDDNCSSLAWNALGNLLAAQCSEEFAAEFAEMVTRRLRVELDLMVFDGPSMSGWSCGFGTSHGCGGKTVPAGYPPVAIYRLTRGSGTVFAPGRHPIGFSRRVYTSKRFGLGSRSDTVEADKIRFGWLADLLDVVPKELPIHAVETRHVTFVDPDDYRNEVLANEEAIRAGHAELLESLVAARLLTKPSAASLHLELRIDVHDFRDDRDVALPTIVPANRKR